MSLAQYLRKRSKEICRDNACTEDQHNCESYAYVNKDGQLLDICMSDYFQGSSEPVAAISLPWTGTQAELEEEIAEQTFEDVALTHTCDVLKPNMSVPYSDGPCEACNAERKDSEMRPKYSIASELDSDEWDAEFRKRRYGKPSHSRNEY
jgi:hypothetical protein